MIYRVSIGVGAVLILGCCLGMTGCARAPEAAPTAALLMVPVSYPVERDVTDYADFTARIAAVDAVDVKAHVWGYLAKVYFKEGALVKKGDVLFELDARPYEALLNQARAKPAGGLLGIPGRRGGCPRAAAANHHDDVLLYPHGAAVLRKRRRRGDAPKCGHRHALGCFRRDAVRHLPDAGVLLRHPPLCRASPQTGRRNVSRAVPGSGGGDASAPGFL
jgi:Biotin-lipoyl like